MKKKYLLPFFPLILSASIVHADDLSDKVKNTIESKIKSYLSGKSSRTFDVDEKHADIIETCYKETWKTDAETLNSEGVSATLNDNGSGRFTVKFTCTIASHEVNGSCDESRGSVVGTPISSSGQVTGELNLTKSFDGSDYFLTINSSQSDQNDCTLIQNYLKDNIKNVKVD